MKVRNGFVSNSSSSSFIVCNPTKPDGLPNRTIEILNPNTKRAILDLSVTHDVPDKVFLTPFLSDCWVPYEYEYGEGDVSEYMEGGHGGPYGTEGLVEISKDVWLREEDNFENS